MLVVAAAGYGKSTWVEARLAAGLRRVAADAASPDGPDVADPGVGAVEDLHRLDPADQATLLERAARRPPGAPLVLSSRSGLDPKVRGLVAGPVVEVGPVDLALSPAEVAALLHEEHGLTDPELPTRVHAATAGWPTLVHLAAEQAVRHPELDPLAGLARPGSAAVTWVEDEVLGDLPDDVLDLLTRTAPLELLTAGLVAAVAGDDAGPDRGSPAVAALVGVGVLVAHPLTALVGREGHRVVPVVREVLAQRAAREPDAPAMARAADWYEAHDLPFAAAEAARLAGDGGRARRLLGALGPRMVAQGDAEGVVRVLGRERPATSPPGSGAPSPTPSRTSATPTPR